MSMSISMTLSLTMTITISISITMTITMRLSNCVNQLLLVSVEQSAINRMTKNLSHQLIYHNIDSIHFE